MHNGVYHGRMGMYIHLIPDLMQSSAQKQSCLARSFTRLRAPLPCQEIPETLTSVQTMSNKIQGNKIEARSRRCVTLRRYLMQIP